MKIKFSYTIVITLILFSCGYKIVDNKINFKINEIVTTGDKKISYHLKNKLSLISSEEEDRLMRVNIITNKTKSIKERNVKNQITKLISNHLKSRINQSIKYEIKKITFTKTGILTWLETF